MENKIKICFLCGGVTSDRWKVSPRRYICDKCYKDIFLKPQEGNKQNADTDKNKQQ